MNAKSEWDHDPFLAYVDRWHDEKGPIDEANRTVIDVYYDPANWGNSGDTESQFTTEMWTRYRNNY